MQPWVVDNHFFKLYKYIALNTPTYNRDAVVIMIKLFALSFKLKRSLSPILKLSLIKEQSLQARHQLLLYKKERHR